MSEKVTSAKENRGDSKAPARANTAATAQSDLSMPTGYFAQRMGNRALSALLGNPVMPGDRRRPDPPLASALRPAGLPGHILRALRSPGQPIGEFNGDEPMHAMGHHGSEAVASARLMGARAYQVGRHVVFGSGQWQPNTAAGRQLIAHELAHVRQTRGLMPTRFEIAGPDDPSEVQADRLATSSALAPTTPHAPVLHLTRDPRLSDALDAIRRLHGPLSVGGAALGIAEAVGGIDLTDGDNLEPVIATISAHFDASQRGEILALFLGALDQLQPPQPVPEAPAAPTAAEEADMERRLDMMRVRRRGPYGMVGPGVLLPVAAQPARHLLPLIEALDNGLAGGGAFASGLVEGLSASMSEADREQLATQLLRSSVLTTVFPAVFASGAAVGIAEDVVETVQGLYHTITHFDEVIDGFLELVRVLLSPESAAMARAMGEQIGRDFGRQVAGMARGNIVEFTFGLGRMIGPTIVYTVLAFFGVPEMLAAAMIGRILGVLRPLIERFPRLLALLERMAARMARTGTHSTADALDADLDRSFSSTFDQPGHTTVPGGPTPDPPELAHGFLRGHLAAFRRLMGRRFTDGEISALGRVWLEVANEGESATLTLANSRRLFDNHRNRFWRAVRRDPDARRLITDAGLVFDPPLGSSNAPFYRLPDGSRFEMTIDHFIERQTDPTRALDAANLRLSSRRENTVLLRQLHDQDIFQSR